MLEERRWNLRSRMCIGMFLLLFCNVVAEVPAATTEIPLGQTPGPAKTLLRRIPTDGESEFSANTTSGDEILPVPGRTHNESVSSEGKSDSSREKVTATPLPVDSEKRTTSRSSDEVDKLVTSEAANRRPESSNRKSRLTNSLDENSGKSSVATSDSEKPLRLTRVNEGINKKANELNLADPQDDQSEEKPSSDSDKVREIVEEESETNRSNVKTSTVRPALREALKSTKEPKKKRVEDFDVKESEESDLEDEGKEKVKDDNASLINDTYVNYGFFHKTRAEKNGDSANGTESNAISKGMDVEEKQDPKKDVEIVKDVDRLPSQRVVLQNNITNSDSGAGNQDGIAGESSENSMQEIREEKGQSSGEDLEMISKNSNSSSSSSSSSSESSSSENENTEEKSLLSSSESGTDKEELIKRNVSTNALPKGRTIGFSSANEFPNSATKTTEVSGDKSFEALPLSKNLRSEVPSEQRPYPYLKSNKNFSEEPIAKVTEGGKVEKITEEPAPFENTIGQSQSEKKFVVTEPSVVIENSIQQVKPNQLKSSTNSTLDDGEFVSIVSTTVSPSTTSPNFANQAEPGKSGSSVGDDAETKDVENGKTSDAENVVPSGNKEEEKSAVIGKTGNLDVTGNGITEINKKLEESFANATEASQQSPTVPEGPSTEKMVTSSRVDSSKADVQTDAEESMLIRSSFNVSEGSTEYPLTMSDETTIFPSTFASSTQTLTTHDKPMTGTLNSTTMTSRNLVTESLKNFTQRRTTVTLEVTTTLNPGETSVPTTTRIEYEFVGLTDAIVSESELTESPNTTTPLTTTMRTTIEDSRIQSNVTTESNEITSTVENVTETSSTEESTIKETEGTTVISEETEQTTVEMTSIELPESTTSMGTTLEDRSPPVESTTIYAEDRKTTETGIPTTSEFVVKETTMLTTESSLRPTTAATTEYLTTTESTTIATTAGTTRWNLGNTSTVTVTTPSTLTPLTKSVSWTTASTPGGGPTERTAEQTTEASSTLSSDEITSLVRIVIEGTWREVCPRLPELRQSLADILSTGTGTDKQVMSRQIVIHQSPCLESSLPTATPSEDPLTSMLIYVVDENGKFDEEMTKVLPSLYYKVSPINFPVTIHSFLLVQEADSGSAIAAVVISSVAFICLLLLAGLLFIMRKRQTRFNYGERCRPVSLDAYSLDSVPACNSVRRKGAARSSKRSYGNPTFEDSSVIPSHPLNFAGLSSFCGDVNAITEEFSGVPQVSAKMDELPAGAEVKNRYANVVPLPETRVPLQRIGNDPLTEYINASYVRGPKNATKYYIACQAPMESTVTDFWRMVWEQQSKVIIMLTDLVENGVEKCHEYIPPSEVTDCHRLFGDYQVTLKKRETKEKYAISTLHLKNLENNTFREVYHIWYLWPVSGVQSDGAGLIAVLLEARALQRGGPGPIVIHCSPGTGRTGTLIALDLGIRQYEITRTVDVPRVVYTIRRDRAGAVQTKEQYAFIYKALNLYATKLAGGVLEST